MEFCSQNEMENVCMKNVLPKILAIWILGFLKKAVDLEEGEAKNHKNVAKIRILGVLKF